MRRFTLLLLLLIAARAMAQVPTIDFKYGVKLSNLSSNANQTSLDFDLNGNLLSTTRTRTIDWLQIVPAFNWQTKKGDFEELSIPMWQLQRQESVRTDTLGNLVVGVNRDINLGVQYTHSFRLLKKKCTKLLPMIGLGMMPFFQHSRYSPMVETDFPYSTTKGGLLCNLKPHVMWMPSGRFYMDLGLQFNIIDVSYARYRDGDPRLQNNNTTTAAWNLANGSNGIILGAGVKL